MFSLMPKEEEKKVFLKHDIDDKYSPQRKKFWPVSEELVDTNKLKKCLWQQYNSGFSVFSARRLSWSSLTNEKNKTK